MSYARSLCHHWEESRIQMNPVNNKKTLRTRGQIKGWWVIGKVRQNQRRVRIWGCRRRG